MPFFPSQLDFRNFIIFNTFDRFIKDDIWRICKNFDVLDLRPTRHNYDDQRYDLADYQVAKVWLLQKCKNLVKVTITELMIKTHFWHNRNSKFISLTNNFIWFNILCGGLYYQWQPWASYDNCHNKVFWCNPKGFFPTHIEPSTKLRPCFWACAHEFFPLGNPKLVL